MTNTHPLEIALYAIIAITLASTFAIVPVWCGVMIAWFAYARVYGQVQVVERSGYLMIACSFAPVALVIARKSQPAYNVWQLQGALA